MLLAGAANAGPLTIETKPLAGFGKIPGTEQFGGLAWRGGMQLVGRGSSFGGLSGLSLSSDCSTLTAVSDGGFWFRASLNYADGKLASVSNVQWAPMLDEKGKPFRFKIASDAEALAGLGDEKFHVGFESSPRVGAYDLSHGLNAPMKLFPSPKSITEAPFNHELEGLAHFSSGPWADYEMALSESFRDAEGNIRGWLWKSWKTVPFTIRANGDFAITDAAILPDGDVLILERALSADVIPAMAIRRFDPKGISMGSLVEPKPVFQGSAPLYAIDNMEGLSVCQRDGETRVTIVSDDNFNSAIQRTLLLQFKLDTP